MCSTADEAGKMLNVNRGTVFEAKRVLKEGSAEEVAACELGEAKA